ncbi:uncharacterized protein I206_102671 [Kwoniella pini CBS 10737]|uniref:Major facilitator superfamily (MFS) profile domain-containing protein n=1 Tax=Kwoniella pini CBS 10737 TaxID=1296096 RepID=A0A1B9I628_9TREE|nr:uncharacterized protein I206_03024 [Kwoniella pini CBS 10737]OCF50962.1 hypothetical protein I206_03024 [Kwoniella pini CBS 10737]
MAEMEADEIAIERSLSQTHSNEIHQSDRHTAKLDANQDGKQRQLPDDLNENNRQNLSTNIENSSNTLDPPFQDLQTTQTNLTTSSNKPYSVFTSGQKWFIVIFSALGAIFSPISTNIYVPAIPTLARAFNTTTEKINLTVTIYLVFQALTPSLWGSAGDCYGRRPVFILLLTIYLLSCIGTALCPTSAYWLLMLMRVLQASGGSALIAVGTGVVADIAMPHERGRYLGLFNLGTTVGPALGPLLGGIFAFTLGWRSIFWFLCIFCACVLVPMIFFFPETLRALVGDGSVPPPLLNCTPAALMRRKRELKELSEKGEDPQQLTSKRAKFKPLASFLLFLEPEIALMFTWASLYYAFWYAILTIFTTLLEDEYHVNEVIIGLCYLPGGVGAGISGFTTGRIMDVFYKKEKRRVGGDHRQCPDEFRLERTRFKILPYQVGILLAATIGLAWCTTVHVHIAVPIVLNFFVGIGTGFLTTTTIYSIDLFTGQGGAVTATFNLIRCAMGAVTTSTVQLIVNRMGAGWCFVLLGGICLLATPIPFILIKYGPKWNKRRRDKTEEKKAQNSAMNADTSSKADRK